LRNYTDIIHDLGGFPLMGFGVVLTDKQRLFGNNPGKFFAGTPFALITIRSRKKYEVNEERR